MTKLELIREIENNYKYDNNTERSLDSIDRYSKAIIGLTKRELLATNAQKAIISNADTLREITKATNSMSKDEREAAFFRVVAKIAVQHADALLESLNE